MRADPTPAGVPVPITSPGPQCHDVAAVRGEFEHVVNHLRRIAFLQRLRMSANLMLIFRAFGTNSLGTTNGPSGAKGVTRLSDEPVVAQTVVAAAASIEYIAVQGVGRFAVGRHGQW